MRFLMLMIPEVYQAGKDPASIAPPAADAIAEMMKFNAELADAGALIALDGLHPLARGARVSFRGGKGVVMDAPLPEAKEVVGGYWIIKAASEAEAVAWALRCPAGANDIVEVRRIQEMEDFAPETLEPSKDDIAKVQEGVARNNP